MKLLHVTPTIEICDFADFIVANVSDEAQLQCLKNWMALIHTRHQFSGIFSIRSEGGRTWRICKNF